MKAAHPPVNRITRRLFPGLPVFAAVLLGLVILHPARANETLLEEEEDEATVSAPIGQQPDAADNDPPDATTRAAGASDPAGPADEADPAAQEDAGTGTVAAGDGPGSPGTGGPVVTPPNAPRIPIRILDRVTNPGQHRQLSWNPTGYAGLALKTPVEVVHGSAYGPVLCLTAAVHGDELNGVEIVRRVVHTLNPLELTGTVIAVPIVNMQGFLRNSRYLPDRRDLNRNFPGNPRGSAARRIAHSLFEGIIRHCDALVDLHTGSFHRSNLPQLRADLQDEAVVELTRGFGSMVVLHVPAARGTLRWAARKVGIPSVTLEAGAPMHLDEAAVLAGVEAIQELLNHLHMVPRFRLWSDPQPLYYRSQWVRPMQGGMLFSTVKLGDKVRRGDKLGWVTDPVRNQTQDIRAPVSGRILGMALNQVVMPGFAAFHLGISKGSQLRAIPKPSPPEAPVEEDHDEELEEIMDDPSE